MRTLRGWLRRIRRTSARLPRASADRAHTRAARATHALAGPWLAHGASVRSSFPRLLLSTPDSRNLSQRETPSADQSGRGNSLDRLVLLLDTGSTPSVRLTAARQLGALAATRVSHPSVASHGHASVAPQAKLEDGTAAPSKEGIWRGVDGEWNEVVALVQRVRPLAPSARSSSLIVPATGPPVPAVALDRDTPGGSVRSRLHFSRRRHLGSLVDRSFHLYRRRPLRCALNHRRRRSLDRCRPPRLRPRPHSPGWRAATRQLRQGVRQARRALRRGACPGAEGRAQEPRARIRRWSRRHRCRRRRRAGCRCWIERGACRRPRQARAPPSALQARRRWLALDALKQQHQVADARLTLSRSPRTCRSAASLHFRLARTRARRDRGR